MITHRNETPIHRHEKKNPASFECIFKKAGFYFYDCKSIHEGLSTEGVNAKRSNGQCCFHYEKSQVNCLLFLFSVCCV